MLDQGFGIGCESHFGIRVKTALYCERESYASAILLARMESKALEPAPIWCGNLEEFDGRPWRGIIDSICAGFPCQPFSQAGKREGTDDERWIWPDIARIIGEVGPSIVFLENVPGLLIHGGIEHVLGTLAELDFSAECGVFSAEAVGAAHLRERVFILAYASRLSGEQRSRWKRILDFGQGVADTSRGFVQE